MAVDAHPSQLHRLSADEYRRLVDAGVFDEDARVELIDGLLLDMSPKTRAHENVIAWLNHRIMAAIDVERFEVRVAAPLTIGASEPEPDIAIIEQSAPRPNHPSTAALVIEVAASSLIRDLREKPRVYAQAGVPEYWVLDVDGRRVVVHREPRGDAYHQVSVAGPDDQLDGGGVGLPAIAVGDLLAAAAR